MRQALRFLLLLSIATVMAGCKLAVIVVEGGTVESTGSGTCVASAICIVDVSEPGFSETFTAVPDDGWYFQKWNSGDRLFCKGSADPTCTLSFKGLEEIKAVEDMVASSETFYLMPVFRPSQNIITVDGKQWLQPDLFANLSWDDINEVCPAGSCIDGGKLNGLDMTGWTWASADDINSLFNFYIGSDVLGPGPDSYHEFNSEWVPDFFSDGWRYIAQYMIPSLQGWLRNLPDEVDANAYVGYIGIQLGEDDEPEPDFAGAGVDEHYHRWDYRGGWFYRIP